MRPPYTHAAIQAAIDATMAEAIKAPPQGEDLDGFAVRIRTTMNKALDEYEPFKK